MVTSRNSTITEYLHRCHFCEPKVYVDEAFTLVLPNEMCDILAYPNSGCYPMGGFTVMGQEALSSFEYVVHLLL